MNQAQQMSEALGEAGKGTLGSFEGKLEELEDDLNTVIGGFTAVGKGIMKTGKGDSKTAALIKSTIEDLRRSEKTIHSFRLSAASASEALNKPLVLDIKKYLLGNMKAFDFDNLISKMLRETGDNLPKPIALLKKTWELGNMKNKDDFISRLLSLLDKAGKLDDPGIQQLLNRDN